MSGAGAGTTTGAPATAASTTTTIDWSDPAPSDAKPKVGGLHKQEDGTITPFVGTDPDSEFNVFTYDKTGDKYVIEQSDFVQGNVNRQGPVHVGQFRPADIKQLRKTQEKCETYAGDPKFNGLEVKEGEEPFPIRTHLDIAREHMIKNGMWDVFSLPDPADPSKKWDMFQKFGRFPVSHIEKAVDELRIKGDRHTIDVRRTY